MYKKIAHRANIDGLLENSLSAVERCVQLSVDGIEIDIRHTSDEYPVVFHDRDFQRLALSDRLFNKESPLIHQIPLKELHADFKLKNREQIPRLEDVLALTKSSDMMMFLELKDKIKPKTISLVQEHFHKSSEQLRIISFDHLLLQSLKKHSEFYSQVKMLALHELPRTTWMARPLSGIEGVNANIYHPMHAMYLKALGLEVGMWWLPDKISPLITKSLFGLIDYLTTDNYYKY